MKKYASFLLQIALWAGIWAIIVFASSDYRRPPGFVLFTTVSILLNAAFFNLCFYVLLPIYFSKGKKRLVFLLSMAGILGFGLLKGVSVSFLHARMPPLEMPTEPPRPSGVFFLAAPFFLGLVLFAVAATVRGFWEFERKKRAADEANSRRTEAELNLLKSQINPHFLLNTLNNLYGIALTEPEKTPDALLKLSEMVRYILYECVQSTVPLARDLNFVENFIALQKLRLPPNAVLRVEMPENTPPLDIEPMILIPFIENAFKHGLTTKQPCEIFISIKTEGAGLFLRIENAVFSKKNAPEADESGIGIANTRQRLKQSYPGKHNLAIIENANHHRIELQIHLKPKPAIA